MSTYHTEDELERCTLTGRREILFQLRTLIRNKERISVVFDEGRQSFLTLLFDLSEEKNCLYFDIGGSEETNASFLKSERCQFMGVVDGIRLQFSAKSPRLVKIGGQEALSVTLPQSMLRLQRRDAYRLQLPTTKPYLCLLHPGTPDELALPIYDLSVGGLGIQLADRPDFEPLQKIDNCRIDLRESGTLNVALEIRYVMATESRVHKPVWHVGCSFINPTPSIETVIQRFMAKIEVERRNMSAT